MPPVGSSPGRAATCRMAPEPCCRICGATAWLSHSAGPRLTSIMSCSVSGVVVSASPGRNAPMVFTSTSGGPTSPAIRSMSRAAAAGSVASATSRRMSSGRSPSPRSLRSTATTVRPPAARVTAVARPSPPPAPATIATFALTVNSSAMSFSLDHVTDRPRVALRQVRGRHLIPVIRRGAEPRFRSVVDSTYAGLVARATLRLIDRGDLLAALDRAAARKVTIISAPAGSGKTSLLRAWADRQGQRHRLAMLQVQRDQQDAQQFWLALLAAVHRASATPDFNAPAMVDRVLSELADARGDIALVIDDLHELNSPEALAQLTRLLTSLPPHVHAVLTTRHDLPLRLHQLRLAGELAEIRAAGLRFTERETRMLLDASGIALSGSGAALLHQRTEGWAAGLRLAAISLAGHPDPERFVAEFSGSDRTVAEYLIAEMLERQPPDVQDLLLRTSLLDRVNGELADVLTGRPGSERILLDLEAANAFVESLDPERTWFRYHRLFGDLLRLELRRTLPEDVPTLHRRAAGWFIRQGQIVDAIRQTKAAGDW